MRERDYLARHDEGGVSVTSVTVGVPVRNAEASLERALASLLGQTHRNLEIVVSDNASTDRTMAIVERFAAQDSRVRFVKQSGNLGVMRNFETVLELAESDYFMWAAADDEWDPTFVSRLLHELETHADAVVAMSSVRRRWPDGREDVVSWQGRADPATMGPLRLAAQLAAGMPFHLFIYGIHRTALLRSVFAMLPRVQGPDRLLMCELALAGRWRHVDRVLYTRQIADIAHAERHGDAPRIALLASGPFTAWRLLGAAVPYLARSKGIPLRRKMYIPLLIPVFAKRATLATLAYAKAALLVRAGRT